jgi:hypothetical protein
MRSAAADGTIIGMTVIATLTVERPDDDAWPRSARAYEILVDGAVRGTVRSGGSLALAVPPGRHTVRARLSWTGSDDLPIHLGSGGTVRLRVEPRGVQHLASRHYLRLTAID